MVSPVERVTRIQRIDERNARTHENDLDAPPHHETISDENKLISEVGQSHLPKKERRVKLKKRIKQLKKSTLPDFNENF